MSYDKEENDRIKAITTNLQAGDQDDKEFERRLKMAQTMLKEKEIDLKLVQQNKPPAGQGQ